MRVLPLNDSFFYKIFNNVCELALPFWRSHSKSSPIASY